MGVRLDNICAVKTRELEIRGSPTVKQRIASLIAVMMLVLGASMVVAPAAQAAPECRGVSGIVQCWPDRVQECISNLRYPPSPC